MASEEGLEQSVTLRNILSSIQDNETGNSLQQADSVSQLLAAAVVQYGRDTVAIPTCNADSGSTSMAASNQGVLDLEFNPQGAAFNIGERELDSIALETTLEVPMTIKKRPLCVKLPIDVRKKIISMRKEGKKCADVAKELHVSVSGAQKVWERFLATGMIRDRRPSTYAGRPRKYFQQEQDKPLPLQTQDTSEIIYEVEPSAKPDGSPSESRVPLLMASSNIFVEAHLDLPGETVEIVESESQPSSVVHHKQSSSRAPAYRQDLLLKLVRDCPLATLRSILPGNTDSPHVMNLSASINKPLYMEYVLGHPFGKPPAPHPFEGDAEEAKVVLSDPVNPIGKEMLATLGYSTKVYFNACCKPSPVFDVSKVLSRLPFSMGPGYLAETMQAVLQLLVDLCTDQVSALHHIPSGAGPLLVATSADGELKSQHFSPPVKLSEYWSKLYSYAEDLECCENFLSASKPSAPCLLCHPYESLVSTLDIKDEVDPAVPTLSQDLLSCVSSLDKELAVSVDTTQHHNKTDQQVEIQVLQSGQIKFSTEAPHTVADKSPCNETSSPSVARITRHIISTPESHNLPTLNSSLVSQPSKPGFNNTFPELVQLEISTQTTCPSVMTSRPLLNYTQSNTNTSTTFECYEQDTHILNRSKLSCAKINAESEGKNVTNNPHSKPAALSTQTTRTRQHTTQQTSRTRQHTTQQVSTTNKLKTHPQDWCIQDVVVFISGICSKYKDVFEEHEVDGESLLTLDPEMMVKLMNIKTGPALKIHRHILDLKNTHNISSNNFY